MKRKRAESRCPDCNEVPKVDANGDITCACKKLWYQRKGVAGTDEEKLFLESKGFQIAQDCQGDVYYVWPDAAHIVHLYPNNEWYCDKAPADCSSLEEYLTWLDRQRAHIALLLKGDL